MTTTTDTIQITVNGEDRRVAADRTVADLLEELELHPGMVVVERNRDILDRERLDETPVREGDSYELVHFVGGG